jgi:hypothetical protein
MPPPIYCIDTSSIIRWFVEIYPPTIFPGLQNRIEELIAAGRLCAPKAVYDEIKPGDDCHIWAKQHASMFVEESIPVQGIVRHLMATYANTAKPHKAINGADPFVIAMAKRGGEHWIVVSDEYPGSSENPKIPFVCAQENVACITLQEMMLAEGWQFR